MADIPGRQALMTSLGPALGLLRTTESVSREALKFAVMGDFILVVTTNFSIQDMKMNREIQLF